MAEYIESKIGDNGRIFIEASDARGSVGFGPSLTKSDKPVVVEDAFNRAMETIRLTAETLLQTLNALEKKPDQVKVDFALNLNHEVGAMLARADSREAQLRVSLAWQTTSASSPTDSTTPASATVNAVATVIPTPPEPDLTDDLDDLDDPDEADNLD